MWPIAPLIHQRLRWCVFALLLLGPLLELVTLTEPVTPNWKLYLSADDCFPFKSWRQLDFEQRVHTMQACLQEEEEP